MPERRLRDDLRDLARLLGGHRSAGRDPALQDVATRVLQDPDAARWIVPAVNLSLRARQQLALRLRLQPRALASRAAFALRGDRAAAPRLTLSLLCPTRVRPREASRLARSVSRTAVDPARVELLFYVDDDDPAVDAYRRLGAATRGGLGRLRRCAVHVEPPIGVPRAWNELAARAEGDLLLMANDDQVYVDHGWDVALDRAVAGAAATDGILCAYFEAGQYPDGAADFPIVSRRWYELLGYFAPTQFRQWEVENWMFGIARRIDRLVTVPGVFVEHRHYQDYKAPFDDTYLRHRVTREKSFEDHTLFVRTAPEREREATRLRAAIDAVGDADHWFADYLGEHAARIAAEVRAAGDGWERAELFVAGRRDEPTCARFPVTAEIVSSIPEATTHGPGVVALVRRPDATEPEPAGVRRVRVPLDGAGGASLLLDVRERGLATGTAPDRGGA